VNSLTAHLADLHGCYLWCRQTSLWCSYIGGPSDYRLMSNAPAFKDLLQKAFWGKIQSFERASITYRIYDEGGTYRVARTYRTMPLLTLFVQVRPKG